MARPEGPTPEARRAEERSFKGREDGVLGEGMFPSPPARGSGERCKLPLWFPVQSLGDQSLGDLAI